jgi:hypothetical protein
MSSAQAPTLGNSSLTSMPHWPYFLNANGERISAPVLRSVGDRAAGQRLAVILVERRFGIEAVDLRQAAVHEQEDDVLRASRMVERGGAGHRVADEAGKGHHAEAVADAAQCFAAGDRTAGSMRRSAKASRSIEAIDGSRGFSRALS